MLRFVFYNEHLYGDVQQAGADAILRAMGISAALALGVMVLAWRGSRPR